MWRLLKIKSLTTIFKVAGYFSAEYVRSLEEHTQKKTGNKTWEISCAFTISNDANAPVLVEVFHLNSTALDQVESIAGDHLIIFRILDSECYHSQWFCLEFGFWLYCSCGFLFCVNSLVNLVLCTLRMTEFKALCLILRCRPLLRFSLLKCYWNKNFVPKISFQ